MRKLKSLWPVSVMLLLVSCSISAKSDKPSEAGTAFKGEVVTLNKAKLLQKVFNHGENVTKWIYEDDRSCIIGFHVDWCGPCKQAAPILRDLAILYKSDIIVYKVNVNKERELIAAFGIQSTPTFLFILKEEQPQTSMGALSREEFVKQIDTFSLKKK